MTVLYLEQECSASSLTNGYQLYFTDICFYSDKIEF